MEVFNVRFFVIIILSKTYRLRGSGHIIGLMDW